MTQEPRKAQYRVSKSKTRAEKASKGYVYFSVQVLPEVKAKLVAYLKTLLCLSLLILPGCTEKTEFGNCIGAWDEPEPDKIYKVSTNNVIVGAIFFELIAPPIIVVLDWFKCPIGVKSKEKENANKTN